MRKRSDTPSRGEITETREGQEERMSEGKEKLNVTSEDMDTVCDTLDGLNGDGSSEGVELATSSIERAQDVTAEVFDQESEEVDEVCGEAEEYQQDLQERCDSTQADLGKISDASGRIQTDEAANELGRAEEACVEDMEFLDDQIERSRTAAEDTRQVKEQLEGHVHGRRR